jgi:uncharacterized protein (UPF0305 family)
LEKDSQSPEKDSRTPEKDSRTPEKDSQNLITICQILQKYVLIYEYIPKTLKGFHPVVTVFPEQGNTVTY